METTLAAILGPYNRSEIARKLATTRGRVNRWASGQGAPDAHELPVLAQILRIDVSELVSIVAQDSKRRAVALVTAQSEVA